MATRPARRPPLVASAALLAAAWLAAPVAEAAVVRIQQNSYAAFVAVRQEITADCPTFDERLLIQGGELFFGRPLDLALRIPCASAAIVGTRDAASFSFVPTASGPPPRLGNAVAAVQFVLVFDVLDAGVTVDADQRDGLLLVDRTSPGSRPNAWATELVPGHRYQLEGAIWTANPCESRCTGLGPNRVSFGGATLVVPEPGTSGLMLLALALYSVRSPWAAKISRVRATAAGAGGRRPSSR